MLVSAHRLNYRSRLANSGRRGMYDTWHAAFSPSIPEKTSLQACAIYDSSNAGRIPYVTAVNVVEILK